MTALHLAAENGHPNIVKLLIQKGALLYKCYKTKNCPFHIAALNGSVECMKILQNMEPDVLNSVNKVDGVTLESL